MACVTAADPLTHARASWDAYRQRNDSVVVDLFGTQVRRISTRTFHPAFSLSLDLPVKDEKLVEVVFIRLGFAKPLRFVARVPRSGTGGDLARWIADKVNAGHGGGSALEDRIALDRAFAAAETRRGVFDGGGAAGASTS